MCELVFNVFKEGLLYLAYLGHEDVQYMSVHGAYCTRQGSYFITYLLIKCTPLFVFKITYNIKEPNL